MRPKLRLLIGVTCVALISGTANAQIKISKPKVKVKTPKVGNTSAGDVSLGRDPSGLFTRCTDDPSAQHHRKKAVENLNSLEAEFGKSSVDYDYLTKLIHDNERSLASILKLEPKVNAEKYHEKYDPLKERADKENGVYAEAQKIEKLFEQEFRAPTEFKTYNPMTYLTDSYGAKDECYCRTYDRAKTYQDYLTSKKEYENLTSQLVGYSHAGTQTIFKNMNTCLENGNKFAIWAATENVTKDVEAYNTENKPLNPEGVIKHCDKYLDGLKRVEGDNSLNYSAEAKKALADGKAKVEGIKAEAERYISSGEYEKHKAKIHAEKIAKVFLPKAVRKSASLESGAMKYVKGQEFADYLKDRVGIAAVASTLKANVVTNAPYVKKNEFGIPKWQYHEIWVAYKDVDGKCHKTAVYASYTYKGGGTFETVPTWGADRPEEMACENVYK